MRRFLKIFLPVLAVALLSAAGLAAWDFSRFLNTPLSLDAPRLIRFEPGASLGTLASHLAEQGVLAHERYARYMDWYARANNEATRLKAGEYRIKPGMTPPDLIHLLMSGNVYQHRLTLIEGWTFDEMMQAINADAAIKHTLEHASDTEVMAAIGHAGQDPEGLFAPNTYYFPRGMSDVQFLKRAYRAMQRILDQAWAGRTDGLPFDKPYQALVLASIIERETAVAGERRRIAGVFVRRLKRGMRLQADPTVIYGLGGAYDGNLHVSDLRQDTPYNTYTRTGLPPTPICMPSAASIRAAVDPAPGDALYFVAKGDGTHHFSATLREHNRAVAKYQLGKNGS